MFVLEFETVLAGQARNYILINIRWAAPFKSDIRKSLNSGSSSKNFGATLTDVRAKNLSHKVPLPCRVDGKLDPRDISV